MMEPELAGIKIIPDTSLQAERAGELARQEMRLVVTVSHSTPPPPRMERVTLTLHGLNAVV
jgi:hypothetical protein